MVKRASRSKSGHYAKSAAKAGQIICSDEQIDLMVGIRLVIILFHLGLITLASTLAPWLFGQLYRSTGSYQATLWVCGPMFLFGGLALLSLGRYPIFERKTAPDQTL